MILLFLSCSAHVSAGLILDAEVRVTSEDHIVGLLSAGDSTRSATAGGMQAVGSLASSGPNGGPGFGRTNGSGSMRGSGLYLGAGSQSPGDLSFTGSLQLGTFLDAGDKLSFFITGFAERTDYQEYDLYDQSAAGVSAGLTASVSDPVSLRLAVSEKFTRYDNDPDRNSTTHGVSMAVKERLFPLLWLRQKAAYETSRATYQDFRYRGVTYRIGAGLHLTDHLLASAGCGFQSQRYQDLGATVLRTQTVSLGTDYSFTRMWSTLLSYDRERTAGSTTDLITRNNILSLSLRYSY